MIRIAQWRWTALALPALLLAPRAPEHITPTVVLLKQADAIRKTLPDAHHFFLRTVQIGRTDYQAIEHQADFKPDDDQVKFYYGTDSDGALSGTVLFPQVNTQHGPLEIALTMRPNGTIAHVLVTKATVETKPWVEAAIKTGFLANFAGMKAGDDPTVALGGLEQDKLGAMPMFYAKITAEAVKRGLVLYHVLFSPNLPGSSS